MSRSVGRRKPSGWQGEWGDLFWTKDSKYGCKYKCQTCGRERLGTYGNRHPYMHTPTCEKLKPTKEQEVKQ